jgi:hypothetical protein
VAEIEITRWARGAGYPDYGRGMSETIETEDPVMEDEPINPEILSEALDEVENGDIIVITVLIYDEDEDDGDEEDNLVPA